MANQLPLTSYPFDEWLGVRHILSLVATMKHASKSSLPERKPQSSLWRALNEFFAIVFRLYINRVCIRASGELYYQHEAGFCTMAFYYEK